MVNYLTTLRGTIGTAGEEFVHSLAIESSLSQDAVAILVAAQWDAMWQVTTSSWTNLFSAEVAYTEATCAEILDLSTGALSAASHAAMPNGDLLGTGGVCAYQVATAISLTAGTRPNGTPLRGRFYLPTPGAMSRPGGVTPASVVTAVVDALEDFLSGLDLNGAQPAVWSRTLAGLQAVTQVRVGNVPDTIRARRNGISETYTVMPNWP